MRPRVILILTAILLIGQSALRKANEIDFHFRRAEDWRNGDLICRSGLPAFQHGLPHTKSTLGTSFECPPGCVVFRDSLAGHRRGPRSKLRTRFLRTAIVHLFYTWHKAHQLLPAQVIRRSLRKWDSRTGALQGEARRQFQSRNPNRSSGNNPVFAFGFWFEDVRVISRPQHQGRGARFLR